MGKDKGIVPKSRECPECGKPLAPQGYLNHVRGHNTEKSREALADWVPARKPKNQIVVHQPIRAGTGARARRMIAKSEQKLPDTFTVMPFITLMGPDGRLYLAEPMSVIVERLERI